MVMNNDKNYYYYHNQTLFEKVTRHSMKITPNNDNDKCELLWYDALFGGKDVKELAEIISTTSSTASPRSDENPEIKIQQENQTS